MPDLPTITAVRLTGSQHRAELPLLVLGAALGISATQLWAEAAGGLNDDFDVVAWDLPGQGHNRAVREQPYTVAELAAGVLDVVDEILMQRDEAGGAFFHAGFGIGGEVGQRLLLDAPGRVRDAVRVGDGLALPEQRDAVVRLARERFLPEAADTQGPSLESELRAALDRGVSAREITDVLRGLGGGAE